MALLLVAVVALVGSGSLFFGARRGGSRPEAAEARTSLAPEEVEPSRDRSEATSTVLEAARESVAPRAAPPPRRARERKPKHAAPLSLSGRVVDEAGEPSTSFSIELVKPPVPWPNHGRAAPEDGIERTFHDSDGRFDLDVAGAGRWQVSARADGERRSAPAIVSIPPAAHELVLVLERTSALAGIVVAQPDGAALPGAEIHLVRVGETEPDFAFGPERKPDARGGADGTFRIERILGGPVRLMARHPEWCDSAWLDLVLPSGSERDVRIALSRGGRIEGSLDRSLGRVADREIGLFGFRGSMGWRDGRTDARGRFAIEHVIPQEYVIELRPTEGAPDGTGIRKFIRVTEDETPTVLFGEPRPAIRVRGTVAVAGARAAGLAVRGHAQAFDEPRVEAETDAHGRFEMIVSGAGTYSFAFGADPGSTIAQTRAVPEQESVELAFELPGGALTGFVVDAGRACVPITAERVDWLDWRAAREPVRHTLTRADGSFEFRLLPSGSYTLRAPDGFQREGARASVPRGRIVLSDLVVAAAEVSGIEIRLPPEGRIAGIVVQAASRPVPGAHVSVLDERLRALSRWPEAWTDAQGRFAVECVAAGTYTVQVGVGELSFTSAPVVVQAGETTKTRIEVR